MSFSSLKIDRWLCTALTSLGIKKPTPVQAGCIGPALSGNDVMGISQTGSGKTAAFAIPILNTLCKDPYGIFSVILTPTRELAVQISEQFEAFSGGSFPLRTELVVGGLSIQDQAARITTKPHIVVATPGRLSWLINNCPNVKDCFKRVKFLVLDEADRLVDEQFSKELSVILEALPSSRQTFYFTATLTPTLAQVKEAVTDLFFWSESDNNIVVLPPSLSHDYVFIPEITKDCWTLYLLQNIEHRTSIVFCSACEVAEILSNTLKKLGIKAISLHAQLPQRKRMHNLDEFRNNHATVLVTTDVASRGLDISTVDLVINHDVPRVAVDYVHRSGRTARIGRFGRVVTLISQFEIELIQKIEEHIGFKLNEFEGFSDLELIVLKQLDKISSVKKEVKLAIDDYDFGQKNRKRRARNDNEIRRNFKKNS
ncbi:hypothetical protein RCL1_004520 [Eukaryota sp. TZLM3-RCL]